MYKNNLLIFKHKLSGEYLRLITVRKSNINTFLEVDINNNPIIKKRAGLTRITEGRRLIKGFENIKYLKSIIKHK